MAKFKCISEAYEVLSNADKRQDYDRYGKEGMHTGMPERRGSSRPAGAGFRSSSAMDDEEARRMFREMFGDSFFDDEGFDTSTSTIFVNGVPISSGRTGGIPISNGFGGVMGGLFDMLGGSGGMAPGSHGMAHAQNALPAGTPVIIHGITARPELNGARAVVQDFLPMQRRYTVAVGGSFVLSLSCDKLEQVVPNVRIAGLTERPDLNGMEGTLLSFDPDSSRFRLQTSLDVVLSLRPDNVVLPNGVVIEVVGVQKRAELNGQWGRIVSFDPVAGRYTVQLRFDGIKMLRPLNLRPAMFKVCAGSFLGRVRSMPGACFRCIRSIFSVCVKSVAAVSDALCNLK
eukprot:gnl/MRDRNA2_/MRDRNA2_66556_c0_seq1.p1 gnl/MRDRNA2_/MRDRNA2_66556_c0~~gnl/MRDRNA2_/MRDRNA2_66556_c0_seq1.p1  ORF type:complete len:343 (-),score=51.42 gnl/MRDRNA2_/MRDRNA2_66556_c0_seq1:20-1048(-)